MRESTKQSNPSSIPNWETLEAWARSSIRDLLQRVLEEEVTEVLGRRRYERRSGVDGPPGSRNGYGKSRLPFEVTRNADRMPAPSGR